MTILAATNWTSNAELIESARDLGYITGRVLDPTYGRGTWWKNWRPDDLVAYTRDTDGIDFRDLPENGMFDTIVFDPPYIPQGGRDTSTTGEFMDRYGLRDGPKTDKELRRLIRHAMLEFWSHMNPKAYLLVKCMSYVSGGKWRPMPRYIANDAEKLGFEQIDELVHLRHPGPQPIRARQLHARRNYSMLLVFQRPK